MYKAFLIDRRIDMEIFEIDSGKIFENDEFYLEAYELNHGIVCLGYNFVEKDKRKIIMSKVKKFGLTQGPVLGKLQKGKTVSLKGKKIKPDDVSRVIKGKKISIVSDTSPTDNCYTMAKDADLLICESTYASKLEGKSEDYNHMTSKQAALIASKANVKKLILTHFSARYKSTLELNDDARNYFDNTECAYDLMKIRV